MIELSTLLIILGACSSLYTLLWMRNLQLGYQALERHAAVTDDNIAWLDEDVEDLHESVAIAHHNIADIVLHFNTPLDQVIFDAGLTEEQEWAVRFVFARARVKLWEPDSHIPYVDEYVEAAQ